MVEVAAQQKKFPMVRFRARDTFPVEGSRYFPIAGHKGCGGDLFHMRLLSNLSWIPMLKVIQ